MLKTTIMLTALIFISSIVMADDINEHDYANLAKEVIKPLPEEFSDKLRTDEMVVNDSMLRKSRISEIKREFADLVIKENDLTPEFIKLRQYYEFLVSGRLKNVIDIDNGFINDKIKARYHVKFRIFSDAEKAVLGLNEYLSSFSRRPKFECTKGSKTGKRFGDLTVWTSDSKTANTLGMIVLYKNIFVDINLVSQNPLDPALIDNIAEIALMRMKLTLGENTSR